MIETTKKLALKFKDEMLIEEYYQKLKGIFLYPTAINSKGMVLDLNSLPTEPVDFKTTFIKWMLEVNAPRLLAGEEPIMTLELAMKCPIFKVIKAPVKRVILTPEQLFNRPSVKTLGQKPKSQSINKR